MIREIIEIYITAAKVGMLTFGGGYAMLPILQKEVVETKKWNTEKEILDYYALSQCLPGIIMVNTLVFVGQKRKKRIGAIAAGLGAVSPSILIITIIATFLTTFADVSLVQDAFAGIRVCVCVLIFNSIVKLWKSSVVDRISLIIFFAVAILSFAVDITPIAFVVISAIAGIALTTLKRGDM